MCAVQAAATCAGPRAPCSCVCLRSRWMCWRRGAGPALQYRMCCLIAAGEDWPAGRLSVCLRFDMRAGQTDYAAQLWGAACGRQPLLTNHLCSAVSFGTPCSNPASALRALAAGSTDCSSSGQCTDQGATPVGGTPRTSLELGRSSSTPHAQQAALQSESSGGSWDVEQVQPPENLLAVASSARAPDDVYIPLPPAADAAAGEAQAQQQQAAPAGGGAAGVNADAEAAGPADNREVLLSAAIVQQRLKSSSKWLGPAPVVATSATAAVAEAEAAAVVTRRRTGQEAAGSAASSQCPNSSGQEGGTYRAGSGTRVASTAAALAAAAHADMVEGGLHRASSGSGGSGRVAMVAAALSAAAEGSREQAGMRRAGSNGSSRVAQAAAALTASNAGVAAAPAPTPVRPARLKPADAWLADGGPGAAGGAAGTVSEPAGTVSDTLLASHSSSQGSVPVQQKEAQQRARLPQKPASCTAQAEAAASGPQQEQASFDAAVCAAAGPSQQHAVAAPSAGPVGVAPALQAAAAEALAASANQDTTAGLVPGAVLADHSMPAAATGGVGAPLQVASGSAAHQLLQLDGCNDAALSAVRNRQQQLLKQRQLMRQQQQHRKRQEVAAWAAAQRQQHADTAVLAAAEGAVSQDVGPGSSGPDQASDACPDAGATGAVVRDEPGLLDSLAAASAGDGLSQQAVLAADVEFAAAAAAEAGDVLGHSTLGLQHCDSLALSVADEFEVQSWAAWSTTSSINKCPKLQWWGSESSQGRFSQRQQRRMQQQGAGEGSGGGAAQQQRWWQRLLATRQDGSQASRSGAGGTAGPAGL